MPIKVTTLAVRDSSGNIRELFVSTKSSDGQPDEVEYHLESAAVVRNDDGTFVVSGTGEVLTLPYA